MRRNQELITILALSGLFLVTHYSALLFDLYWIFPYLDFGMHTLGGIIVGLIIFFLFQKTKVSRMYLLAIAILTATIITGLWEYFEYSIGATFVSEQYVRDTVFDMSVGIFVASVTVLAKKY